MAEFFILIRRFLLLLLFAATSFFGIAQTSSLNTFALPTVSTHFIDAVEGKATCMQQDIEKKTLRMLSRLERQEAKLRKKLAARDSLAAQQLFKAENKYKTFAEQIKHPKSVETLKEYIPQFDSLKTSFKFLDQANALTSKVPKEWTEKIKNASGSIQCLETKLQQASNIKRYVSERKQQIREKFEKYSLGKHLKKFNKEVYYYPQQLNEYKAMLSDPKKLEQKAIAKLRKLPAFTDFMKKNSQLASLLRLPDNHSTPESLAGLQTRASVQGQLQQRFAGTSVNPQQYLQQQMGQAQNELNKLKDKITKMDGGSSEIEMPNFKPNMQKTKSFLKRIEYGANVQSQKTNALLPVTSDLALTAGYKLNDKSIIGIGAAYKLGWGRGWQHIKLTHEGVGLRSYIDYKLKGSFWISGGYEQNYQHAFTKMDELKDFSAWQASGLIGLTKKYKIAKKTNNLQLLWDFLSYRQVPQRQPLLFRVGVRF